MDHSVASVLVFFDKRPQLIDLGLGKMQVTNQSRAHRRGVLSCQVNPMQNRVVRMMLETFNGAQTVSLYQHRQDIRNRSMRAPQSLKAGSRIGAKGVPACHTVVTSLRVAVDLDVARFDFAKIATEFMVTPLALEFHDASPPTEADDTSRGLSRLGYPLHGFPG
jgi:hypothetical protein